MNSQLPFKRGSTASAFNQKIAGPFGLVSTLPTATGLITGATPFRPDLSGRVFEAFDAPHGNTTVTAAVGTTVGKYLTPGTKQPIKLRCVQAAAQITTTCIGQLVAFAQTDGQYGVVVTDTTIQGGVAKPIDGMYPVGTVFSQYDWFYVVEEGPAMVTPADSQTLAMHGPVCCYDTSGHVGPAAATYAVVGTNAMGSTLQGGITSTTHGVIGVINVKAGVQASEA